MDKGSGGKPKLFSSTPGTIVEGIQVVTMTVGRRQVFSSPYTNLAFRKIEDLTLITTLVRKDGVFSFQLVLLSAQNTCAGKNWGRGTHA